MSTLPNSIQSLQAGGNTNKHKNITNVIIIKKIRFTKGYVKRICPQIDLMTSIHKKQDKQAIFYVKQCELYYRLYL